MNFTIALAANYLDFKKFMPWWMVCLLHLTTFFNIIFKIVLHICKMTRVYILHACRIRLVVLDCLVTSWYYFTASNSFSDCKRGPKKDHLRGLKCNPDPWKMAKKWAREAKDSRSANELVKCKKRWWQHFFFFFLDRGKSKTPHCAKV